MQYFYAQQEHIKLMDKREEEKQRLLREKIMTEKIMRDQQLKKTEHQKRKEVREAMQQEQDTISRLINEMDQEKRIAQEKKNQ